MFEMNNPQHFYLGQGVPKLSKAEVQFFGLIQSGAITLEKVPLPCARDEIGYVDDADPAVMEPLQQNLELLADLYEKCRRFAARRDEQK